MPRGVPAVPGARRTARRASDLSLTIGRRVRAARHARGWSQARLAKESGINPATLRTYEAGDREMPLRVIPRIAAGLGLPVLVLLGAAPCQSCGNRPEPERTCQKCGAAGVEQEVPQ